MSPRHDPPHQRPHRDRAVLGDVRGPAGRGDGLAEGHFDHHQSPAQRADPRRDAPAVQLSDHAHLHADGRGRQEEGPDAVDRPAGVDLPPRQPEDRTERGEPGGGGDHRELAGDVAHHRLLQARRQDHGADCAMCALRRPLHFESVAADPGAAGEADGGHVQRVQAQLPAVPRQHSSRRVRARHAMHRRAAESAGGLHRADLQHPASGERAEGPSGHRRRLLQAGGAIHPTDAAALPAESHRGADHSMRDARLHARPSRRQHVSHEVPFESFGAREAQRRSRNPTVRTANRADPRRDFDRQLTLLVDLLSPLEHAQRCRRCLHGDQIHQQRRVRRGDGGEARAAA